MTNPDKQAFPRIGYSLDGVPGLTIREYFSIMALQGLLANPDYTSAKPRADTAVALANDLIAALNEEQS